jgi:hypothetical protein
MVGDLVLGGQKKEDPKQDRQTLLLINTKIKIYHI